MSNRVEKKIFGVFDGIVRRKSIEGAGLCASNGVNIYRILAFLYFKSHKSDAMQWHGMKLDNFENMKERTMLSSGYSKPESAFSACKTMITYSLGICVETIADATFKSSKALHGWGAETIAWGSIANKGFKPANRTKKLDEDAAFIYDTYARARYFAEDLGVPMNELFFLKDYARVIFNVKIPAAAAISFQVMAVENIIEAAFKASQYMKFQHSWQEKLEDFDMEKLTDFEMNMENTVVGKDEPLKTCQKKFSKDDLFSDAKVDGWEPGFLECRDVMCIFMDCKEATVQYNRLLNCLNGALPNINWARMARFMEYKARKEYAMETYGVRLGDFHSLKENAFRLFEITEAQAENMASQTMAMDSESIAFEKIADAAFKASKIINWEVDDGTNKEVWSGNIADASGFKSPKSMKNFCTNMDIEARKAYTMEALGVSLVEIDYIKDFAIKIFRLYNDEVLPEPEATIMACECFAIDHVVEAASKNLNLTDELSPYEEEEARHMDVFFPEHSHVGDYIHTF